MSSRDENIYLARVAEQAERYDEMAEYMKKVVESNIELSSEERNLLSVAYKNVVGSRRASLRILSSIEQKEESRQNEKHLVVVRSFKHKVEKELSQICGEIIALINQILLVHSSTAEAKVFYHKMTGDYHRYLAESAAAELRQQASTSALAAYTSASEIANNELEPTNPIRLGLALNFSVFYYEIMNAPDDAIRLAKGAFDQAIEKLETLSDESYKDSTLIMQLLRDNLTLWTSNTADDDRDAQ